MAAASNLAHDGPQPRLQNLIRLPDTQRGRHSADQIPDATEHDNHETINDVISARLRPTLPI
jgi:hypothetical protein